MTKGVSKEQPKSANVRLVDRRKAKTLKQGVAGRRFGAVKFGKDGCGY